MSMHRWLADMATVLVVLAATGSGHGAARAEDAHAAADTDSCREPVCLNAARLEADSTHLVLHDFNIVYVARGTTVTGDLAEGESPGKDSKDTHWVLTGHVEVTLPQGHLSADHATMQLIDGRITTLTADGAPASFERNPDGNVPAGSNPGLQAALEHAHAHARRIVYDLEHSQLDLTGDSYLTNGCYEFTAEHMSYDIATQKVQADPRDSRGVHGIMRTRSSPACSGGEKP
jgi:lipopolysaccharide transport protein LptA